MSISDLPGHHFFPLRNVENHLNQYISLLIFGNVHIVYIVYYIIYIYIYIMYNIYICMYIYMYVYIYVCIYIYMGHIYYIYIMYTFGNFNNGLTTPNP